MRLIETTVLCLLLAACGSHDPAGDQGITNSGSYRLGSARAQILTQQGSAFVDYTAMRGTLSLSGDSWSKRIVYRGYSATRGGKFSSTPLNNLIGTFTMYSSNRQYLNSGSYNIGTVPAVTLNYDADSTGSELRESWIRN